MRDPFTSDQIDRLSSEIDSQLRHLSSSGGAATRGRGSHEAATERQKRAIEQATGEDASSFLRRFKDAARADLCEEGGVLYRQWSKWGDIANKDILKTFGGVLVGMGLAGTTLQIVVVALAVWVLFIGLKAFCAEA